jgi:hypothetical protein
VTAAGGWASVQAEQLEGATSAAQASHELLLAAERREGRALVEAEAARARADEAQERAKGVTQELAAAQQELAAAQQQMREADGAAQLLQQQMQHGGTAAPLASGAEGAGVTRRLREAIELVASRQRQLQAAEERAARAQRQAQSAQRRVSDETQRADLAEEKLAESQLQLSAQRAQLSVAQQQLGEVFGLAQDLQQQLRGPGRQRPGGAAADQVASGLQGLLAASKLRAALLQVAALQRQRQAAEEGAGAASQQLASAQQQLGEATAAAQLLQRQLQGGEAAAPLASGAEGAGVVQQLRTAIELVASLQSQLHSADQRAARAQTRAASAQEEVRGLAGLAHELHLLLGGVEQEQPGGAAAQQGAGGEEELPAATKLRAALLKVAALQHAQQRGEDMERRLVSMSRTAGQAEDRHLRAESATQEARARRAQLQWRVGYLKGQVAAARGQQRDESIAQVSDDVSDLRDQLASAAVGGSQPAGSAGAGADSDAGSVAGEVPSGEGAEQAASSGASSDVEEEVAAAHGSSNLGSEDGAEDAAGAWQLLVSCRPAAPSLSTACLAHQLLASLTAFLSPAPCHHTTQHDPAHHTQQLTPPAHVLLVPQRTASLRQGPSLSLRQIQRNPIWTSCARPSLPQVCWLHTSFLPASCQLWGLTLPTAPPPHPASQLPTPTHPCAAGAEAALKGNIEAQRAKRRDHATYDELELCKSHVREQQLRLQLADEGIQRMKVAPDNAAYLHLRSLRSDAQQRLAAAATLAGVACSAHAAAPSPGKQLAMQRFARAHRLAQHAVTSLSSAWEEHGGPAWEAAREQRRQAAAAEQAAAEQQQQAAGEPQQAAGEPQQAASEEPQQAAGDSISHVLVVGASVIDDKWRPWAATDNDAACCGLDQVDEMVQLDGSAAVLRRDFRLRTFGGSEGIVEQTVCERVRPPSKPLPPGCQQPARGDTVALKTRYPEASEDDDASSDSSSAAGSEEEGDEEAASESSSAAGSEEEGGEEAATDSSSAAGSEEEGDEEAASDSSSAAGSEEEGDEEAASDSNSAAGSEEEGDDEAASEGSDAGAYEPADMLPLALECAAESHIATVVRALPAAGSRNPVATSWHPGLGGGLMFALPGDIDPTTCCLDRMIEVATGWAPGAAPPSFSSLVLERGGVPAMMMPYNTNGDGDAV